jgi:hypothetical protein
MPNRGASTVNAERRRDLLERTPLGAWVDRFAGHPVDDEARDARGRFLSLAVESRNRHMAFHHGPRGACISVSHDLLGALLDRGHQPRLVKGRFIDPTSPIPYEHYWVECDGHVIDPTADQFNGVTFDDYPPVVVADSYKGLPHHVPLGTQEADSRRVIRAAVGPVYREGVRWMPHPLFESQKRRADPHGLIDWEGYH